MLTVTLEIDTKGVEGVKFLNPLRHKGQSVIGVILARPGGGGHSNGKRGYQARPWTHKKYPNHVLFRSENRP